MANFTTNKQLLETILSSLEGKMAGSGGGSTKETEIINRTISGEYSNNNITLVGDYVFCKCSNLTSIDFPVCKTIRNGAFQYCLNITSINFPECINIGNNAFENCFNLTSINFPACTNIGMAAFRDCEILTSINFPLCTAIGVEAFYYCSNLTSINFPACTNIGGHAFYDCSSLTTVNLPVCKDIGTFAFCGCSKLISLTLGASSVAYLTNVNAFQNTPMSRSTYTGSFGSIYVPASLVDSYKSATNWVNYADRIVAIGSDNNEEGDSGNNNSNNNIKFTIDDFEYQAENGMTWEEWIDSPYNTQQYVIVMFGQIASNDGRYVSYNDGEFVNSSEIIEKDGIYDLY